MSVAPLQFLLLVFAGWVNRRQLEIVELLQEENRALREQLGGRRLRFTNAQRRRLAATASGEAGVIRRALANILAYGSEHALGAVAIPALGMGTGGLSREACCAAFRDAIANHAASHPRTIIIVLWSAADYDAFAAGFATDARFATG